jgi:mRNA interferase MazF
VKYLPEQGDIVTLDFTPQAGHEHWGRRPAVIVSNLLFNRHVGLALACPITNTQRDFPFHVAVRSERITGFVMVEQVKSIDYRAREICFVEKAPEAMMREILALLATITQRV